MKGEYRTVFEVSYFSNGGLMFDLNFLCVGIVVLVIGLITPWISKRMNRSYNRPKRFVALCIIPPLFFLFGASLAYSDISNARKLISELANNQCGVVEGTVQVLYEMPSGGHSSGDHIRIGDEDFIYSDFIGMLGYNRTISHGGQLKNGVMARLHYIENGEHGGNEILKVEIKQ
jgi:hypothetical protein